MIKLIKQFFGFGIIGIICFLLDYCLMIGLTELGHLNYLVSSGISFALSVIVNYLFSMKFVFSSRENMGKIAEFIIFVVLSVIGLGLNVLLMWIAVEKFEIFYMISKIIVTAIVMIYNFVTRKLLLDSRK